MKTNLMKMIGAVLSFTLIGLFPSCIKDGGDAGLSLTGTTYLRIANTKEGTQPQDFYLDNTKINVTALAYGQNSGYIATNANPGGSRAAQFVTNVTSNLTVAAPVIFQPNQYYTVYLTGNGSIYTTLDDMTAPASGKSKVRFISVSTATGSAIDVWMTGGSKFIAGLLYSTESSYYSVDPVTAFTIYTTGSATALLSIPGGFQAGKIYTIYISGSTTASLSYNVITQN